MNRSSHASRALFAPAFLIGFALSGLFDGILLHQVLQWHHLLSLVEGERFRDVRVQILADGVFHALMYGLAAVGLGLLWSRRERVAAEGTARRYLGALALGFGAWNVVDAVLFHWVLRLHHIRLGADGALLSDVLWLVGFGVVPLLVGWRLWRVSGGGTPATASSLLTVLVLVGAGLVSLAPASGPMTAVLFRPGLSDAERLAAVTAVDGRLAWADGSGQVMVIALNGQAARWRLYRHGAILVGGAGPAGCLAWATARL